MSQKKSKFGWFFCEDWLKGKVFFEIEYSKTKQIERCKTFYTKYIKCLIVLTLYMVVVEKYWVIGRKFAF